MPNWGHAQLLPLRFDQTREQGKDEVGKHLHTLHFPIYFVMAVFLWSSVAEESHAVFFSRRS